jgi:hypothetical protein
VPATVKVANKEPWHSIWWLGILTFSISMTTRGRDLRLLGLVLMILVFACTAHRHISMPLLLVYIEPGLSLPVSRFCPYSTLPSFQQ